RASPAWAHRRPTARGSSTNASCGAPDPAEPLRPSLVHSHVPSVTTAKMRSTDLCDSQYSNSRFTHSESVASGDANNTNHSDASNASRIDDHNCGFADNADSSRNSRNARTRNHGFANRCKPRCKAGANRPSAACEYDTNAS